MTLHAPRQALTMVEVDYQNPDASMPLRMPVLIVPNTPGAVIDENVQINSRKDIPWLEAREAHDRVAVLCGGGPSLAEHLGEVAAWKGSGAAIFAANGVSRFLSGAGIIPDCQVIVDAQPSSAAFCAPVEDCTYLASAVDPRTVRAAYNPVLFHLNFEGIEENFPREKVERGGYALLGGGVSVGITMLTLAWALGYRTLHLYGYDSSNRDGATHAYSQPQNAYVPNMSVEWAGKTYHCSMPMKLQAEAFIKFAVQLQDEGVDLHVHGDGLLPAMWLIKPTTEREKYQKAWSFPGYREVSPGECSVPLFLKIAAPEDVTIIDFGCGTGRAALKIRDATGCPVIGMDFTDNSRDMEASTLPFVQHDLTEPIPIKAGIGYCSDVMEHIPPQYVQIVIQNIMESVPLCFFQIATFPDIQGEKVIGSPFHLSVHPFDWWKLALEIEGLEILWSKETAAHALFYVRKTNASA